ncbi:hypothetical protein AaE_015573 [Aphanomyces astaci]|uniref:Uncharacterized protein n=1 Tax=Aphanomyces astaci TaxID=112090 RepID=A0A6A4YVK5_APHAT|nr:hypothetical protein AaE_015573 [Aphanomyces astaci]
MKFLAALVHATVASQVLLNNPASSYDEGRYGYTIYSGNFWGVEFRTPSLGDNGNIPGIAVISSLTLDHFKFSVRTPKNVFTNASIRLRPGLCPSVHGSPDCNEPMASSRISIDDSVDGVNFQWTPKFPIIVTPNTTYWFWLDSTSETRDNAPEWLRGDNRMGGVRLVQYKGGGVEAVESDYTPSLQVYAKRTLALQCRC